MTALAVLITACYILCAWLIWRDWRRTHVALKPPVAEVKQQQATRQQPSPKLQTAADRLTAATADDLGPIHFSREVEPMKRRRRR